ncbi:hypothetical protein C8R46DRAFT_1117765 [Mycena filopes]|nr:hypothetical protein C8R46DRAFT_1117765 [Mycena filopes]
MHEATYDSDAPPTWATMQKYACASQSVRPCCLQSARDVFSGHSPKCSVATGQRVQSVWLIRRRPQPPTGPALLNPHEAMSTPTENEKLLDKLISSINQPAGSAFPNLSPERKPTQVEPGVSRTSPDPNAHSVDRPQPGTPTEGNHAPFNMPPAARPESIQQSQPRTDHSRPATGSTLPPFSPGTGGQLPVCRLDPAALERWFHTGK